jgi:hypothetical protein
VSRKTLAAGVDVISLFSFDPSPRRGMILGPVSPWARGKQNCPVFGLQLWVKTKQNTRGERHAAHVAGLGQTGRPGGSQFDLIPLAILTRQE